MIDYIRVDPRRVGVLYVEIPCEHIRPTIDTIAALYCGGSSDSFMMVELQPVARHWMMGLFINCYAEQQARLIYSLLFDYGYDPEGWFDNA